MNTSTLGSEIARERYAEMPGLSNSGMKDLAISPLRYWHLWINPNRPERKETPEMAFGTALHCAVLEPDEFGRRYARQFRPSEFEGCLITVDDIRGWLKDKGLTPKGARKADLIAQAQQAGNPPIWDVIQEHQAKQTEGKILLAPEDWDRVSNAVEALRNEPALAKILEHGKAEVPMFARDPDTGVILKCRMDWVSDACTMDLKTFSQQRGKSIDKSVADAIWYERYYRQAYLYSYIRSLQPGFSKPGLAACAPPFVLAFVESEEPHEVRIRELRPKQFGEVNMLWERARIEVDGLIRLYAECVERFGEKPWREERGIEPLEEQEFPALAYS